MTMLLLLLYPLLTSASSQGREEIDRACEALLSPHLTFAKILPHVSDEQALTIAKGLYLEVSTWLSQEMNETAQGSTGASRGDYGSGRDLSPSRFLFGRDYVEVNRTAVAFLALKWLLAGDYERFVRNQPDIASPLTRDHFDTLSGHVRATLATPEEIDAMIVMILTNDLGKVRRYHEMLERTLDRPVHDHDDALFQAMKEWSEMSPSFHRLPPKLRARVMTGLKFGSKLNVGQLALGEALPANLAEAKGFADDPAAFDFKMIEMILDIAGARGHEEAAGAVVYNEHVHASVNSVRTALHEVMAGGSPREAYDRLLNLHNEVLHTISVDESADRRYARAQTRLELMAHATTFIEASEVALAFFELPPIARAILIEELNVDGIDDGWGILPYYAPALFLNALASGRDRQESLRWAFLALARAFQEARIHLVATAKDRPRHGVLTLDLGPLAQMVRPGGLFEDAFHRRPKILLDRSYDVHGRPGQKHTAEMSIKHLPEIRTGFFPKRKTVASGVKGVVFVGVGGGSDVLQAAQLAHLHVRSGGGVRALVSFRTARSGSETGDARTGPKRDLENVERVGEELFRVGPTTRGAGRVLEPLVAGELPTLIAHLSLDESKDGRLAEDALNWIRAHVGEFDEIVLVDTGGDSLHRIASEATLTAAATPDQDLRVLRAFASLASTPALVDVTLTSAVVGAGIDSPPDAEGILIMAEASYWHPNDVDVAEILKRYVDWNLTGESNNLFGKTPYAWQAALKGESGVTVVPLPERVVTNRVNPWNPFARVPVKGVFLMRLADHLRAIGD